MPPLLYLFAPMHTDFIIIGQGLAGSSLAVHLIRRGYNVAVIDNAGANHSSRIAAGLFNPITGKKFVKTWLADTLFPFLHSFYNDTEVMTGARFFYPMPVYRPFLSVEEQNEWMARSADPAFSQYIGEVHAEEAVQGVHNPLGGLMLKSSGFLDTKNYIGAVGKLISANGIVRDELFDETALRFDDAGVVYRDLRARKIIFCAGTHQNKLTQWLPVNILKGETLSIRCNLDSSKVINRGVYMVPYAEGRHWKTGATYNFTDKSLEITPQGRAELEEKITELVNIPYQVENQEWGFRPVTPDRRPILGPHPELGHVIIFNGLGTKGVTLAPYFSSVLADWLEGKGTIPPAVDIRRFYKIF